jgi:hypothetical protein
MPKYDKNQYTLPEVYAFYKEQTKDPVDYKLHKAILDLWGNKVIEYLLQGKDIRLHRGLSILGIRKHIRETYIDRQASKEAGRTIRASNIHSGFYGAVTYWRRHYTSFSSGGWGFYPTRKLNRALSAVMQTPRGHMRFVKRAKVTNNQHRAGIVYTNNMIR